MDSNNIPSQPIKPWWQSKLVWIGVIQMVIAAMQLFTATDWADPLAMTIFVTGLLTIVSRWLTDEPITSVVAGMDRWRPKVRANPAKHRPGEKTNHALDYD